MKPEFLDTFDNPVLRNLSSINPSRPSHRHFGKGSLPVTMFN